MNDRIDQISKEIADKAQKAQIESKAHTMMLEMFAALAPESKRPVFTLPVLSNNVAQKVGEIMMLALQMDDEVEYAVKACEFLQRVEEACDAFIKQAKE